MTRVGRTTRSSATTARPGRSWANLAGVVGPVDVAWGADGNLYVGSRFGGVYRVNGVTGSPTGVQLTPSAP